MFELFIFGVRVALRVTEGIEYREAVMRYS